MSITIYAAIPCEPVVITFPSGRQHLKDYEFVQEDEQFINWSQTNAYRALVALGLLEDGGNVDMMEPIAASDVIRACDAFAPGRASEFMTGQSPMMQGVLNALSGDGAKVIDCSPQHPQDLVERVDRLKSFAEWALTQHAEAKLHFC